jgi:hypothetical protein
MLALRMLIKMIINVKTNANMHGLFRTTLLYLSLRKEVQDKPNIERYSQQNKRDNQNIMNKNKQKSQYRIQKNVSYTAEKRCVLYISKSQ